MSYNISLLTKIVEQITRQPGSLDMDSWEGRRRGTDFCGTTRCIAGWAFVLGTGEQIYEESGVYSRAFFAVADEYGVEPSMQEVGAALLGLSEEEAEVLFYEEGDKATEIVTALAAGLTEKARDLMGLEG